MVVVCVWNWGGFDHSYWCIQRCMLVYICICWAVYYSRFCTFRDVSRVAMMIETQAPPHLGKADNLLECRVWQSQFWTDRNFDCCSQNFQRQYCICKQLITGHKRVKCSPSVQVLPKRASTSGLHLSKSNIEQYNKRLLYIVLIWTKDFCPSHTWYSFFGHWSYGLISCKALWFQDILSPLPPLHTNFCIAIISHPLIQTFVQPLHVDCEDFPTTVCA